MMIHIPTKKYKYLKQARTTIDAVAAEIMAAKRAGMMKGLEGGKDLMSLLLRANAKEDEKWKLSDEEIVAEIRWVRYSPKFLPDTHPKAHSTIIFIGGTFRVPAESLFYLITLSHRHHYFVHALVRPLGAGQEP